MVTFAADFWEMIDGKKIAIHTLGCKLNFSESSTIARNLQEAGYERVDFSELADYYIINTCSVTENADKKCQQLVRQINRRSNDAGVVIIGCYAQLKPDEISKIEGVDLVLGASEKFNIADHITKIDKTSGGTVLGGDIRDVNFFTPAFSAGDRTRTFLKVQDGCDYHCAFCTIPLARGRSRSHSITKTLEVAKQAAETGVKEIVLTGVNIGDYGKTNDGKRRTEENFYQLIQALDEINGIERWRISSIEPNLLSTEIIEYVAQSDRFVPHFHLPLQSGSDVLLKKMRRKYDTALYRDRVAAIKSIMPDCCIGVDVIVGFPGESESEFEKTIEFLTEIDVSYLHVFTYSERNNTIAPDMNDPVPMAIRRERSKTLRNLSQKKRRKFYTGQLDQTRPVLFEAENDEGWMYGFTDNYVKVKLPYDVSLVNEIRNVHLTEITQLGVVKCAPFNQEKINEFNHVA